MGVMYVKGLPRDNGGEPMQEYAAPVKALKQYTSENASVSSVITLTQDTTAIEVTAVGGTAALRWVPRTETAAVAPFGSVIAIAGATANYDNVIPTNQTRRFVVPYEVQGAQQGSVVGANRQNGLYQRVAYISVGVSSVMTSEF